MLTRDSQHVPPRFAVNLHVGIHVRHQQAFRIIERRRARSVRVVGSRSDKCIQLPRPGAVRQCRQARFSHLPCLYQPACRSNTSTRSHTWSRLARLITSVSGLTYIPSRTFRCDKYRLGCMEPDVLRHLAVFLKLFHLCGRYPQREQAFARCLRQ